MHPPFCLWSPLRVSLLLAFMALWAAYLYVEAAPPLPFSPGKNSSEREAEGGRENTQVWGGGPGQKHGLQLWLVLAWMSQLDFPVGLSPLIRLRSEFFGKPGHHLSTTSSAETGKLSYLPLSLPLFLVDFPF